MSGDARLIPAEFTDGWTLFPDWARLPARSSLPAPMDGRRKDRDPWPGAGPGWRASTGCDAGVLGRSSSNLIADDVGPGHAWSSCGLLPRCRPIWTATLLLPPLQPAALRLDDGRMQAPHMLVLVFARGACFVICCRACTSRTRPAMPPIPCYLRFRRSAAAR